MASFYSKVAADRPKNANKGGDNTTIGVTEGPRPTRQKDFFPESAKTVPAKFLGGDAPNLGTEPYRPALAQWMTSPDNPYFAKSMVNRTWAHLFGRGFVNPIDDMLPENDPTHPDLLDAARPARRHHRRLRPEVPAESHLPERHLPAHE